MWHFSRQPCSKLSLFGVIDVMGMIDIPNCQGGLGDGDPCRLDLPTRYNLHYLCFSQIDSVIPPISLIRYPPHFPVGSEWPDFGASHSLRIWMKYHIAILHCQGQREFDFSPPYNLLETRELFFTFFSISIPFAFHSTRTSYFKTHHYTIFHGAQLDRNSQIM